MAIAPNTIPFVSGSILTAAQMTALPMGIYSFVEKTTNTPSITTETVLVTLPSFTAVANRYYRVTGMVGIVYSSPAAANTYTLSIRKGTTTGGTLLQVANIDVTTGTNGQTMNITWTGTLTAGAQQMVLTGQSTASTSWFGSATQPLQFFIEDIGGA